MSKIAILTDSIACLTKEQTVRYKIEVVPMNLMFEGKIYQDGIDLTTSQAYGFLEKNPEVFSTSAPSPGKFLEAYKKLSKEANEIIYISFSAKMSTAYNSAQMAKTLAKKELPHLKIEIIDSATSPPGETLLVLAVVQAIKEGKSLEEIIYLVKSLKEKVKVFALLDTIRYLHRTGRIPEVASKIGGILPFKPIICISGGKPHIAKLVNSRENGIKQLLQILRENLNSNQSEIGIMHANVIEEAQKFKEQISSELNYPDIFLNEVSPVVGYVLGPGVLLIAFYSKN
jgi:DegV family protein with EDD domain